MREKGPYIANSYQTPNFIVDYLDQFLTPIETKVLHKVMRSIIGWHDSLATRKNAIPLSEIVDGSLNTNGERESWGCGLNRKTVQKALNHLHLFGIITKTKERKPNRWGKIGAVYGLNFDTDSYNWEFLEQRQREIEERNDEKNRSLLKSLEEKSHGKIRILHPGKAA